MMNMNIAPRHVTFIHVCLSFVDANHVPALITPSCLLDHRQLHLSRSSAPLNSPPSNSRIPTLPACMLPSQQKKIKNSIWMISATPANPPTIHPSITPNIIQQSSPYTHPNNTSFPPCFIPSFLHRIPPKFHPLHRQPSLQPNIQRYMLYKRITSIFFHPSQPAPFRPSF